MMNNRSWLKQMYVVIENELMKSLVVSKQLPHCTNFQANRQQIFDTAQEMDKRFLQEKKLQGSSKHMSECSDDL